MSPKDDGISEVDEIRTVYTVGPGLRMAIIFVCFAVTLGGGTYGGYSFCKKSVIAGDKSNQVEVLKSDTKEGLRLVQEYLEAEDKIRESREGRKYDKKCGDMLISDIIK
jgi:hypothetical protein